MKKREGKEATIRKVRRIWYWDGANSLSQLAVDGTLKPQNCKFAIEVDKIEVTEAIEIIECTEKARKSIQGGGKRMGTKINYGYGYGSGDGYDE